MINVLIAEDDALTRIGLQSMMSWEKFGYTVVGVAENGQEALDLALELRPHIVITDIRMPVLDGLQLIKALKHEQLDMQFIILSAHNDFVYVREALQLGAVDYLLKLDIEPDLLLASLKKAADLLPEKAVRMSKGVGGGERQLCIKKLLMGKFLSEQEIITECKALQIGVPRKNLVLVSCVEDPELKTTNQVVHYPEIQTIERTLEELLREYGVSCGCVIRNQEYVAVVSLRVAHAGPNYTTTRYELITKIQEYFLRSYNIYFSVHVSAIMQRYLDIPAAYKVLRESMESSNKSSNQLEDRLVCRRALQGIREALEEGSEEAVTQSFDNFLACLATAEITNFSILQSLFISLVHEIDLVAQENELDFLGWKVDDEIVQVSNYCLILEDFQLYAKRVQLLCASAIAQSSVGTSQSISIAAKNFIDRQYADQQLLLSDIAASVNVSENYLCRLFKRELDMSPMQYLTQVRLSHAKRLLKVSNLLIKDICARVGYANPFYFTRLFKRHTGITPTEFRGL